MAENDRESNGETNPHTEVPQAAWDWERPLSANYMFTKEEREIIIKCVNIVMDEYYFHPRDFRTLMASDAKQRFPEIVDKIKNNQDLNKDDGEYIKQAVMQVSMFPMAHRDEIDKQFDFDVYHLFWFSSHIEDIFED